MAPSMPVAKAIPFKVASRSAGYQSANAESAAISPPETPSPMTARASVSSRVERASANQSAPPAAISSSVALTRLGP